MVYYYQIGKNKFIRWNTKPSFRCPKALEEMKDKSKHRITLEEMKDKSKHRITIEGSGGQHSELVYNGEKTRKILINTSEETPEGTIRTFKELIYAATKKTPPICKCGEAMVLRYPVWYEYRYPRAKIIAGFMRDGTKDKTYWTKYFRTKKGRDKFVERFHAKHQKNEL